MSFKYLEVAAELQAEISKGFYEEMLPTEQELTARYQISRQTVRKALKCLVDRGLIEKKQGSGSRIKASRLSGSDSVAVIIPQINDYIFPTVLQDIQVILSKRNYSTLLFAHQNKASLERSILQKLLQQPIAGIIIATAKSGFATPNADLYEKLRLAQIPVIFLYSSYPQMENFPCVKQDNYGGGYMLTRHLIMYGHTKIAGFFPCDLQQGQERYLGYTIAMRDAGLSLPDDSTIWYTSEENSYVVDFGHPELIDHFIDYYMKDSTAVVCYNDMIADQVVRRLLLRGLRVPEDVAVVSFDNSDFSNLCPVSITSLEPQKKHLGSLAAELLFQKLDGLPCESISVPWKLIRKESS
jgi:GntR family transcriptional regulator of arabinose operon